MELFTHAADQSSALTPLAERLRPKKLADVVGQDHLLGPGQFLSEVLKSKKLPSLILWGPPGTGKTTIAKLLAGEVDAHFEQLSAVSSGVKDLRAALEAADQRRGMYHSLSAKKQTVLFIDEIHRFNKAQQDALLHHVEKGAVVLVGATTENPSFEVNAALLSRARVIVLKPLERDAIAALLERAWSAEHGLFVEAPLDDAGKQALQAIAVVAQGDARRALSVLETVHALGHAQGRALDVELVKLATQHKAIRYDADGDQHYQIASAMIKSLRGSDPDAAMYWMARMLEGGEDPVFICRRLVIFASEDIGNADPGALAVAMHATDAVRFVGLPEAQLVLAQACTYLALAHKSNKSMEALHRAQAAIQEHGPLPVPAHLVNASTALMKRLGMGDGYDYPHDHPDGMGRQTYLPDALQGSVFYDPVDRGREAELKKRLDAIRAFRKA
ncbi:MAG: replication-associated recombination protein A [Deltaproteobacteria bacterium]|nr:replication-associated recombination protein A [Deltaproteobacteria bacterium]